MEVREAIWQRCSIRGYLNKPVPKEILEDVLKYAARAVSAVNAQPWKFYIAAGEILEEIREANQRCIEAGTASEIPDVRTEGIYRRRRVEVAKQLFGAMEIAREDIEKRTWWENRGIQFFDAPVGIIVTVEKHVREQFLFDIGCVVQNFCVAAMQYGLGTCVADQPLTYCHVLREKLHIPDTEIPICGIAIGYPDPTFPANHVRTDREHIDKITAWYGFE